MKRRLKVMAAIFGIAAILMSEQSLFHATAVNETNENEIEGLGEVENEEVSKENGTVGKSDENEIVIVDEVEKHEDATTNESETTTTVGAEATIVGGAESGENSYTEHEYNAPYNLAWSMETPGTIIFECNNSEKGYYIAELYKDGVYAGSHSLGWATINGTGMGWIQNLIFESGNYTFKVGVFKDYSSDAVTYWSNESEEVYHYIRPENELSVPNIKWSETNVGTVAWDPIENPVDQDHEVSYRVRLYIDGKFITWCEGGGCLYDFSKYIGEGARKVEVEVCALSRNIEQIAHSRWSERVAMDSESGKETVNDKIDEALNGTTEGGNLDTIITYNPYVPKTAEERKRYSCYSKENISYITAADNAYKVIVVNSLQGKCCFDSFEAVLGDYTIGRTYNIFPYQLPLAYNMTDEVTITLAIPKSMQKEGRIYQMICVTEDGLPIILNDLDIQESTITFRTNKFHAFALVYKDTK